MGVELNAVAVDWPILLGQIEEKPGRLRRASFFNKALDKREPWLEDLSGALGEDPVVDFDPTDSTMIQVGEAYDRVREGLTEAERDSFDRFAGAFFWIGVEHSPYSEPPVRDLGPKSDPEVFWSSYSPETVAQYLELWKSLDLDRLRAPFDERKGHLAFRAPKSRNAQVFEQRFRPYLAQFGKALEAASAKSRGLVLTFL